MADALRPQDHLYTLVTRDRHGTNVRVIGSLVDFVLAAPGLDPLVARLAAPETRIVSLTITEGGYPVDEATGDFLAPPAEALPAAFEALARGFQARRAAGLGGFTVLSCDNIMGNGDTARTATLGVCAMVEPGLEAWVDGQRLLPQRHGRPHHAPDRGVRSRDRWPGSTALRDRWPVVSETFIQWVIEDEFAYGRPPYEDAGVLLTHDVRPYETLKLRILNAGHSTSTYMAALVGHVYIHEIMEDPLLARFMQRFHDDEATPSLPPVPGIDVEDYKRVVRERFANPRSATRCARVCLDGSSKFPKFLIPTIESQLDKGGPREALGAGPGRLVPVPPGQGRRRAGTSCSRPIPAWSWRARTPRPRAPTRPPSWASRRSSRRGCGTTRVFRPAFVEALTSIREEGVHATLDRWLGGSA